MLAGKTGVWLGSRLQSFNNWAGHAQLHRAGQAAADHADADDSCSRTASRLLAVSVAGGDVQDQTTLQLCSTRSTSAWRPAEAVTAPRFGTNHHLGSFRQAAPELGSLLLANGHETELAKKLEVLGHKVTMSKVALWAPVMLRIDPKTGAKDAAGDPRATAARAGRYFEIRDIPAQAHADCVTASNRWGFRMGMYANTKAMPRRRRPRNLSDADVPKCPRMSQPEKNQRCNVRWPITSCPRDRHFVPRLLSGTASMNRRNALVLSGLLLVGPFAFPQGTPADYERSARLSANSRNKVFRDTIEPRWYRGRQPVLVPGRSA